MFGENEITKEGYRVGMGVRGWEGTQWVEVGV